jgi:hypothetical protein
MMVLETNFSNGCYVKSINSKFVDDDLVEVLGNSEDKRINLVTTVAAISRGNDNSKNPTARYKKLLKEAAPNMTINEIEESEHIDKAPGRPLEFSPVVTRVKFPTEDGGDYFLQSAIENMNIQVSGNVFLNDIMPFSYLDGDMLYTNMRALLSAGVQYKSIPYSYVTNYKIVEVKAPYFVFAQIRTHGKLSQVAVSERVVTEDEYWLPEGALHKVRTTLTSKHIEELKLNCIGCDKCRYGDRIDGATTIKELVDIFLELPIKKVQAILKIAGYHKEVYDRWPNHLKMKRWIIGGYTNDPKQWPHFLLEREAYEDKFTSWVQETTKEVAMNIKKVVCYG